MQIRQPPVQLICSGCGKTMIRTAWEVRKKQKRHGHTKVYCSDACARDARWPTRSFVANCAQCGKEIVVRPNRMRKRGKYGPFCNHACYGQWRTANLSGENSPAWKGGYELWYEGNWKSQRAKARKRDNYTCQDCGTTEQTWGYALDVHHIIAYDLFGDPKEANRLGNLVTLCRTCHVKRHVGESNSQSS